MEALVRDAFRHRLVLSYQALAEEVDADMVLDEVLKTVRDAPDRSRAARARDGRGEGSSSPPSGASGRPPRPGPGPRLGESLRALDLAIGRRVDGLLAGDYRSAFAGLGSELLQVRPYEPGDDVRRIDWNVTARTGTTHVRVELAERVLVTWLVFDSSASMAFGTADRRKADVAEGVALAVGHVATRRGNRLGVVTFGPEDMEWRRPRQGRRGLLLALGALREAPAGQRLARRGAAARRTGSRSSARSSSSSRTSAARSTGTSRCCASPAAIRRVAVEIRDPREQELADVGELRLVDPETGRQLRVDTRARVLRERFAARPPRSARGSCGCSPRSASATSRSRPRATGCGRSPRSSSGAGRQRPTMSFASPWLLLCLLLVPAAIVGYLAARAAPRAAARSAGRRARADAEHGSRAGPGCRRYVPLVLFLIAPRPAARRLRAAAGDVNCPREGATVVLALDVSGSMDAKDVNSIDGPAARRACSPRARRQRRS